MDALYKRGSLEQPRAVPVLPCTGGGTENSGKRDWLSRAHCILCKQSWSQLQLCPCFLVLGAELKTLARQRLVVMDHCTFCKHDSLELLLWPCFLVLGAELQTLAKQRLVVMDALYFPLGRITTRRRDELYCPWSGCRLRPSWKACSLPRQISGKFSLIVVFCEFVICI